MMEKHPSLSPLRKGRWKRGAALPILPLAKGEMKRG